MSRYGLSESIISSAVDEIVNGTIRAIEHEMGATAEQPHDEADSYVDQARDAANRLIEMAGYDNEDSDYFGKVMGDTVQSLLMTAFLRCPQMSARILGYDEDIQITTEEV